MPATRPVALAMPICIRSSMLMSIAAVLMGTIARATPQHTISLHSPNDFPKPNSFVMDSRGAMMRREEKPSDEMQWKSMEVLLSENAVGASKLQVKAKQPDLYVLIGRNRCEGGGSWKHYELTAITPGRYDYCSAACDGKDECVGFDVGNTGCNLYTQKAVALGTWPGVKFQNSMPFPGEGDHNRFPLTPFELKLSTLPVAAGENYQCYRKTFYKPVDSYYWLIGNGTCSKGGLWKRYVMSPANYSKCANACDLRDECIGFDVGTWAVSDETEQVHEDTFNTSLVTTTGCFMYTQKAVYGTWPSVQDITAQDGEGDHDRFPPTPYDLQPGFVARYQAGNGTKCYGKTHWVSLEQYYMELGHQVCGGGGVWKHYKMTGATVDECKGKCDEKDECVGVDFEEGVMCRLYTRSAIPPGSWSGVDFDTAGPFAGEGDHDHFPPTPFALIPSNDAPTHSKKCLAKTHYEDPDQVLSDSEGR